MEMTDKAVSTEDLCYNSENQQQQQQEHQQHQHLNSTCIEVARLEGVLNTLLENKVEAIKNDRSPSQHSSPKMLINRFRIISTSESLSSKDKDSAHSHHSRTYRKHRRRKNSDEIGLAKPHKSKRSGRSRQRICSSSPESPHRYAISRCCEKTPQHSDEEAHQAFLPYQINCQMDDCLKAHQHCSCRHDNNTDIQMTFDEDYVSLKIEDFDDIEEDVIMTHEALKRARRKRRKRRKRRMKRQLAITAVPVVEENVKVLDPDELPQRARWTIVATACLLLFMCLLLVGVTLRMAPIIDDMVRRENEELMNSLHREQHSHSSQHNTSSSSVPE